MRKVEKFVDQKLCEFLVKPRVAALRVSGCFRCMAAPSRPLNDKLDLPFAQRHVLLIREELATAREGAKDEVQTGDDEQADDSTEEHAAGGGGPDGPAGDGPGTGGAQ
jgi:hypothetical protein